MSSNEYHHADEIITCYSHKIWIGDVSAAEDINWLKQHNIKTVFTAATGFNFVYDPSIRHFKYDLQDKKSEKISDYFDHAAYQIEKYIKLSSILIHCGAGVSRSPTLVIAYLIRYKAMTFSSALKLCKSKRPQVCPNLGFQLQLKAYQNKNNTKFSTEKSSKKHSGQQLPELLKHQAFQKFNNITNRSFSEFKQILNRGSHVALKKSIKPNLVTLKQRKEVDYLKKMAEFRFGITNMQKWNIKIEKIHKPFNFF